MHADKLVGEQTCEILQNPDTMTVWTVYKHAQLALHNKENIQLTSIENDITHIANGPKMEHYLLDKYRWSDNYIQRIDLIAIMIKCDRTPWNLQYITLIMMIF